MIQCRLFSGSYINDIMIQYSKWLATQQTHRNLRFEIISTTSYFSNTDSKNHMIVTYRESFIV